MTNKKTTEAPIKDRITKKSIQLQTQREEGTEIAEYAMLAPDVSIGITEEQIDEEAHAIENAFIQRYIGSKAQIKYKTDPRAVITPDKLSQMIRLLTLGHTVEEVGIALGFSLKSYYRFLEANPNFGHVIDQAKSSFLKFSARKAIAMAVIEGNLDISMKVLEAHDPAFRRNPNIVNNNTQNNLILDIPADRAGKILDSIQKKAKILQEGRYGTITRTRPIKSS